MTDDKSPRTCTHYTTWTFNKMFIRRGRRLCACQSVESTILSECNIKVFKYQSLDSIDTFYGSYQYHHHRYIFRERKGVQQCQSAFIGSHCKSILFIDVTFWIMLIHCLPRRHDNHLNQPFCMLYLKSMQANTLMLSIIQYLILVNVCYGSYRYNWSMVLQWNDVIFLFIYCQVKWSIDQCLACWPSDLLLLTTFIPYNYTNNRFQFYIVAVIAILVWQ